MKQLLCLVLLLPLLCFGQFKVPPPFLHTDIHDYDNVLSQAQKDALDAQILGFRKASSIEIAVVILSDLQGREIEDVATTLFRSWGIGKKELNNGVLYIVSPANRKGKIEVGNGLEGDLPDITTKDIQIPARDFYRNKDYYGGIDTALKGIISTLKPISWQQRQDLKAAREKEQQAAIQSIVNFFKWLLFSIVVLGSAIFFVGRNAKIKRKQKEEAERKLREAARQEQDKQMRIQQAELQERKRKSLIYDIRQALFTANSVIGKQQELAERNSKDYNRYGVDINKLFYNLRTAAANLSSFVNDTSRTLTDTTSLNDASRTYNVLHERIDCVKQCIREADNTMQTNVQKEKYVLNFLKTAPQLHAKALQLSPNLKDDLFKKFSKQPTSLLYLLYDDAVTLTSYYDNIINAKLYEQQRKDKENKRKLEEQEKTKTKSSSYSYTSTSYSKKDNDEPSYNSTPTSSDNDSGNYGGGSSSGGGSTDGW